MTKKSLGSWNKYGGEQSVNTAQAAVSRCQYCILWTVVVGSLSPTTGQIRSVESSARKRLPANCRAAGVQSLFYSWPLQEYFSSVTHGLFLIECQ